MLQGVLR
ncbi:hypothetical protein LINGRAHAP2_LOCUS2747 [Linum grandiflorum]